MFVYHRDECLSAVECKRILLAKMEDSFEESKLNLINYASAPYGVLLGVIVTTPLLIDACKQYILIQRKSTSPKFAHAFQRQKWVYILLLLYLFFSLLTCINVAFIRNNTFTSLPFTTSQCFIGFYSGYTIFCITKVLMYSVFLYRLRMVFHRSPFQYSPRCYRIIYSYLYTIPMLGNIIFLSINYTIQEHWVLQHNPYNTNQLWCITDSKSYDYFAVKIILVLFAFSECIGSSIILLMFTKGLRALQRQLIEKNFAMNTGLEGNIDVTERKQSESNGKIDAVDNENGGENGVSEGKTVKVTVANRHRPRSGTNSGDLQFIIDLHELIKRQTILVSIAILSSLSLWGLSIVAGAFSLQLGWDIVVNVICVWMTLKSSRRYYDCCAKYGFCWICYRNKAIVL